MRVVERMRSAATVNLNSTSHFLRKLEQEELAKKIIQFAQEHGIISSE
jgi:hypothetical protein